MTKPKKKKWFDLGPTDNTESWLNRTWRPAAAVVYLLICVFDFIIAPAFMGFKSANIAQLAGSVKGLDPAVAIAIIQNRTPWQPLTLQGSGLFHVAFGAILGVAAWTRGSAQIEQIRQQGESDRSPYTPSQVTTFMPPIAYQGYPVMTQPQPAPQAAPVTQVNVQTPNPAPATPDNPDAPAEPDKY